VLGEPAQVLIREGELRNCFPGTDGPEEVRETGVERTTSVSRYHSGVAPYGVYDTVGNVWEGLPTPTTPGRYELRGSAFTSPLFRGVPAIPNDANDTMHDDDTGFRCVATPEKMEPHKR
jgi:formylglycine-generating enzyme required for sulfatase activity